MILLSSRDTIQHCALVLHALAVIGDLTGNSRHDLLDLLACCVIEALRDPRIIEAEIAGQPYRLNRPIFREGSKRNCVA